MKNRGLFFIIATHIQHDVLGSKKGIGDKSKSLSFATDLIPVQPNLITLSRCDIVSAKDNIIEIDDIDAFPDTPVLDIKP